MTRGKQVPSGAFQPPQVAPTAYLFPLHPQTNEAALPNSEGRTDRSDLSPALPSVDRLPSYQLSIEGPDIVEVGQLVRFSVNSQPPLPAEAAVFWSVLQGPELSPRQVSNTSIEYLIPGSNDNHLRIRAEVRFPGVVLDPVIHDLPIRGTTLTALVKSLQGVVSQGRFSPRFTQRLANHLMKAQQATVRGGPEPLARSLRLIASDCATVLKKKSDPAVATLYHQARWLQSHLGKLNP